MLCVIVFRIPCVPCMFFNVIRMSHIATAVAANTVCAICPFPQNPSAHISLAHITRCLSGCVDFWFFFLVAHWRTSQLSVMFLMVFWSHKVVNIFLSLGFLLGCNFFCINFIANAVKVRIILEPIRPVNLPSIVGHFCNAPLSSLESIIKSKVSLCTSTSLTLRVAVLHRIPAKVIMDTVLFHSLSSKHNQSTNPNWLGAGVFYLSASGKRVVSIVE